MGTLAHALAIRPFQGEVLIVDDDGVKLLRTKERKGRLTLPRKMFTKRLTWMEEGTGKELSLHETDTVPEEVLLVPTREARRLDAPRLISKVDNNHDVQKLLKYLAPEEIIIIQLIFFKSWSAEEVARWAGCTAEEVRRSVIQSVRRMREKVKN